MRTESRLTDDYKRTYVYVAGMGNSTKIGITTNVERRIEEIEVASGGHFRVVTTYDYERKSRARWMEQRLLEFFARDRIAVLARSRSGKGKTRLVGDGWLRVLITEWVLFPHEFVDEKAAEFYRGHTHREAVSLLTHSQLA